MAQRKSRRGATHRAAGRKGATRRSSRRTSRSSSSQKPDAIRMLKEDHDRVKEMFDRFERTRGEAKERLASKICDELTLHAQLEEQLFYPAVREAIGEEDLMNEAEVEHQSAKELIRQIRASSSSDPRYDAMVTVLGEYVKHHIKEEEGELFEQAEKAGTKVDWAALGEQMKNRKAELMEELLPQQSAPLTAGLRAGAASPQDRA